jgi:hypothetical protein
LIGITNQLDLTDRSLSRLQTKCELKPKLVHFSPYTKQQSSRFSRSVWRRESIAGRQSFSRFWGYQRHGGILPEPAENPDHDHPSHHQKHTKSGKLLDLKKLETVIEENGDGNSRNWFFIWIVH